MSTSSPIEHVVIIVKENHTFDNYFSTFPRVKTKITKATLRHSNNPPDPMEVGVLEHGPWLNRAQTARNQQFFESDIPKYFEYARRYTLCDHYFTEVSGPSGPNHLMLIAAYSPVINNPTDAQKNLLKQNPITESLPSLLGKNNLDWRNYSGYMFSAIKADSSAHYQRQSTQFATDAKQGDLPAVCWVYAPDHGLSEHPPINETEQKAGVGNVTAGSEWTARQVEAVMNGPAWQKTVIFVTWDDWGGWSDSLNPPPLVETWKSDPQHTEWDPDPHRPYAASLVNLSSWDITQPTQFRYGSRSPCLVISPHAKKGHISKSLYSHVSLLRFCELIFELPNINDRDKNADPMTDCFPPEFWTSVHR